MQINIKTRPETCERHGSFESRNFLGKMWTQCPACVAEKRDADEKSAAKAMAERAEAQRLAAWQKAIGMSGIPERFQSRTLDNYTATTEGQRRALSFAREYVETFEDVIKTGRSALFVGQPGTGKTHIACGIGMHLIGQRRPVLFSTVMRALRRIKDSWVKGSDMTETEVIDALVYPDLLILDEVGVQTGSEFERNALFDIINERYERRRPVILMSNLARADLTQYLGERVLDRLREDGGKLIPFDWESHRGKKVEQ